MTITILGAPRTAKNSQSVINVGGRRIPMKGKALKSWEKNAAKQITGVHRKNFSGPVNLAVKVWIDADRRCDLVGFIQAANDMLVANGVLKDDSGNNPAIVVMHNGSRIVGVDRKNPRMVIEITPLTVEAVKPITGFTYEKER